MHTTRSLDATNAAAQGAGKVAARTAAEGVEKPSMAEQYHAFFEQDSQEDLFGGNELVPQNVNEQELIP
jgi:hypothetical protein